MKQLDVNNFDVKELESQEQLIYIGGRLSWMQCLTKPYSDLTDSYVGIGAAIFFTEASRNSDLSWWYN